MDLLKRDWNVLIVHTANTCVAGASEDLPAPLKRSQSDQGLASFKSRVLLPALKEYFTSGDSSEVARCLQELNQPGLHSLIVTQVSSTSLSGYSTHQPPSTTSAE